VCGKPFGNGFHGKTTAGVAPLCDLRPVLVWNGSGEFCKTSQGLKLEARCLAGLRPDGGRNGGGLVGLENGVEAGFGGLRSDEPRFSFRSVTGSEGRFAASGVSGANFFSKRAGGEGSGRFLESEM